MNRIILTAFAATICAGCTTPASVASGQPFFTGQSAKEQDAIAGCVAAAWGGVKGFNARTERQGSDVAVILSGTSVAGIDMIAKIGADGRVEMYRRRAAWGNLDDRLAQHISGCL